MRIFLTTLDEKDRGEETQSQSVDADETGVGKICIGIVLPFGVGGNETTSHHLPATTNG